MTVSIATIGAIAKLSFCIRSLNWHCAVVDLSERDDIFFLIEFRFGQRIYRRTKWKKRTNWIRRKLQINRLNKIEREKSKRKNSNIDDNYNGWSRFVVLFSLVRTQNEALHSCKAVSADIHSLRVYRYLTKRLQSRQWTEQFWFFIYCICRQRSKQTVYLMTRARLMSTERKFIIAFVSNACVASVYPISRVWTTSRDCRCWSRR